MLFNAYGGINCILSPSCSFHQHFTSNFFIKTVMYSFLIFCTHSCFCNYFFSKWQEGEIDCRSLCHQIVQTYFFIRNYYASFSLLTVCVCIFKQREIGKKNFIKCWWNWLLSDNLELTKGRQVRKTVEAA